MARFVSLLMLLLLAVAATCVVDAQTPCDSLKQLVENVRLGCTEGPLSDLYGDVVHRSDCDKTVLALRDLAEAHMAVLDTFAAERALRSIVLMQETWRVYQMDSSVEMWSNTAQLQFDAVTKLVDICVRSGRFVEALNLLQYQYRLSQCRKIAFGCWGQVSPHAFWRHIRTAECYRGLGKPDSAIAQVLPHVLQQVDGEQFPGIGLAVELLCQKYGPERLRAMFDTAVAGITVRRVADTVVDALGDSAVVERVIGHIAFAGASVDIVPLPLYRLLLGGCSDQEACRYYRNMVRDWVFARRIHGEPLADYQR